MQAVHDLHVTQIATGLPVLTAHVVVDDECFHDGHAPRMLDELQQCVAEHFPVQIEHSTFQLEIASHGGDGTPDARLTGRSSFVEISTFVRSPLFRDHQRLVRRNQHAPSVPPRDTTRNATPVAE